MDMALRPMSISQVLDRTFYLYRKHFILFAGIAIITPALRLVSLLVQLQVFGRLAMPQTPEAINPQFMQALAIRFIVAFVLGSIIYLVGSGLAASATAYAVSMVHLGKPTTIVEAYRKVSPILGRVVGLICLVAIFTFGPLFGGYLLFIMLAVGGALLGGASGGAGVALVMLGVLLGSAAFLGALVWIFFALCRYSLAVPACTIENLPVIYAIRRSKFLTDGAKWGILGIILLTALMSISLGGVLQIPVFMAGGSALLSGKGALSTATVIWSYIADFISAAVAGPIATVALALVYYDQRVRKEAFDLQLMMEAIGQTAPAISASAAASAVPPPPPPIG